MIRAARCRAAGQLVRRVQAETDYRYPRRFKKRYDRRAVFHRVGHRVLLILPRLPQIVKRRIAHYDGRVYAHAVRMQGDYLLRRVHRALHAVAGESGHHLEYQPEARGLYLLRRADDILRRVSAAGQQQYLVAQRLRAKLYRLHAVSLQPCQHRAVYCVRPRGKPYRVYLAAVKIFLRRAQQRLLLAGWDGREAAPIKRQLPLRPVAGQGGC